MDFENISNMLVLSGASKATAKAYCECYRKLYKWLGKDPLQATKVDLYEYIGYLENEKKMAPNSINQTIFALRKLYDLYEVEPNPAAKLRIYKIQRVEPEVFETNDIKDILDSLPKRNYARNSTIVALAALCGLRKSEILNLNIEDIEGDCIKIVGKGNKLRVVPLPERLNKMICNYIGSRKSGPVFLSESGGRLSTSALNHVMATLENETGKKVYMHKFRHTAATNAYEASKDIRAVQDLLGHASINTTQIYVHVSREKIKSIIEQSDITSLI